VPSDWTLLEHRLKVCTCREDFRQAVYDGWKTLRHKWKEADWAWPFPFVLEQELEEIDKRRRAAFPTGSRRIATPSLFPRPILFRRAFFR
jgi:hypothetical protein